MEYLLISGAQDVGKTKSIYLLVRDILKEKKGFQEIDGKFPKKCIDFIVLLEGKDKDGKTVRIIVNSPTDHPSLVDRLKNFKEKNQKKQPVNFLISSVRDGNQEIKYFFDTMDITSNFIEVPLAKIIPDRKDYKAALKRYQDTVSKLLAHILEAPPFDLKKDSSNS